MSTLFNIWNPRQLPNDALTFDVTQANMPSIGSGSEEWIGACLEALEVSAEPEDWSLQRGRCHYYCSYPDEPVWEDRWPETWAVTVQLDGAITKSFGPPSDIPVAGVETRDETWNINDDIGDEHDRTAFLPMVMRASRQEVTALTRELREDLNAEWEASTPSTQLTAPDWFLIRAVIHGSLFPDRVEKLEGLLERYRNKGLAVHHYGVIDLT